ncbi:MAG: hypothetical protein EXR98_03355 [Gemmataceae bacterium]|nr:hypothetical protein [Gemmataceae bacterium]
MVFIRRNVWLIALAALLRFALATEASPACCEANGLPLLQQFNDAQIVLFGHFENAKPAANGVDFGTSEFVIERTFKDHDALKGKTRITLSRYIPDSKTKYFLLCEIYKGRLDAYKGVALVNDREMIRYLDGAIKIKTRPPPERLRYAFDFLNSQEPEVAMDAYREFASADYRDYQEIAKKLPAATIAGWLKDEKTPSFRHGLYAMLLGHCGGVQDAKLLLSMIDDPDKRRGSSLNGFLMAYTILEPEKGWSYIKDLVQSRDKPFLVRYAGLQTMRFLRDSRPDLVNPNDESAARNEIVKGVASILDVPDMADFAMEDLRKWQRWDYCAQVLDLWEKKGYETAFARKAILRYALQCDTERARKFVEAQRARDPEWVDDIRELLELETKAAPKSPK